MPGQNPRYISGYLDTQTGQFVQQIPQQQSSNRQPVNYNFPVADNMMPPYAPTQQVPSAVRYEYMPNSRGEFVPVRTYNYNAQYSAYPGSGAPVRAGVDPDGRPYTNNVSAPVLAPAPAPIAITQSGKFPAITQTAKQAVTNQNTTATQPVRQVQLPQNLNIDDFGMRPRVNTTPAQLPQNLNIDDFGMRSRVNTTPAQLPQNLNIDDFGMRPRVNTTPAQLPQNLNIDDFGMRPRVNTTPVQLPQNLNIDDFGMRPRVNTTPAQLPQNLNIDDLGMRPRVNTTAAQLPQNYSNDQYNMAPIPRVEDELERLPTANNIPSEQLTLRSRSNTAVINLDNGRQIMVKTRIQRNPVTGEDEQVIDEGAFINVPLRLIEGVLARVMGLNKDNTNDLDVGM